MFGNIPLSPSKRFGLFQSVFACEQIRPQAAGQYIVEIEEPGFPAVPKPDLVAPRLRHDFVPDDADAAVHQN
jgi:hypothetical protein